MKNLVAVLVKKACEVREKGVPEKFSLGGHQLELSFYEKSQTVQVKMDGKFVDYFQAVKSLRNQ